MDDFFLTEQAHEVHDAAYWIVSVKVIDVAAKNRADVRLWPASPVGHPVMVQASASEVAKAKTKDGISKILTDRLSEKIAKLFHEYRLGDFERQE